MEEGGGDGELVFVEEVYSDSMVDELCVMGYGICFYGYIVFGYSLCEMVSFFCCMFGCVREVNEFCLMFC